MQAHLRRLVGYVVLYETTRLTSKEQDSEVMEAAPAALCFAVHTGMDQYEAQNTVYHLRSVKPRQGGNGGGKVA